MLLSFTNAIMRLDALMAKIFHQFNDSPLGCQHIVFGDLFFFSVSSQYAV